MEKKISVLFVVSGNSKKFDVAPFIKVQADSLIEQGIDVSFFSIKGKGVWGYIKAAKELRKKIKSNNYDIIHAHYTFSGLTACLSFSQIPIVLSLMGSDAYGDYIGVNKISFSSRFAILLTKLIQPFTNAIICKSEHIRSFVYLKKKSYVIPNGVNLAAFNDMEKSFHDELNLNENTSYVLFLGQKDNVRKNFKLLENAFNLVENKNVELIAPYPVKHDDIVKYLNTVSAIVVPSLMEGSPNVVKEAMACNCPIIATPVGDVQWLLDNVEGHYIVDFDAKDLANKIKQAVEFSKINRRTKGRQRLIDLGLENKDVADKIIELYNKLI